MRAGPHTTDGDAIVHCIEQCAIKKREGGWGKEEGEGERERWSVFVPFPLVSNEFFFAALFCSRWAPAAGAARPGTVRPGREPQQCTQRRRQAGGKPRG